MKAQLRVNGVVVGYVDNFEFAEPRPENIKVIESIGDAVPGSLDIQFTTTLRKIVARNPCDPREADVIDYFAEKYPSVSSIWYVGTQGRQALFAVVSPAPLFGQNQVMREGWIASAGPRALEEAREVYPYPRCIWRRA